MEIRRRILGKEHPETVDSVGILAWLNALRGRWKEAEELGVEAVEIRRKMHDEEHPHALNDMHNLAFAWRVLGRDKEAIALLKECVLLRERVLGQDHPVVSEARAVLSQWEKENLDSEQSVLLEVVIKIICTILLQARSNEIE